MPPVYPRAEGFPAHAGMDPVRWFAARARPRLPRTRGDGPCVSSSKLNCYAASPHTRGWTRPGIRVAPDVPGFPAHAGMDPARGGSRHGAGGLPRTRGDGPLIGSLTLWIRAASPHTRGWTLGHAPAGVQKKGFPAHAGMDPQQVRQHLARARLPRTRGDGPRSTRAARAETTASPHTRGWTGVEPDREADGRGFPAHAGMDPDASRRHASRSRLPRTRGDGPGSAPTSTSLPRASPHTRGWTVGARRGSQEDQGASPHTRGWTRADRRRPIVEPGFPAHAGMDPSPCASLPTPPGLPRTRGDGPLLISQWTAAPKASPHTRGWTLHLPFAARLAAGFPAHAGMDPPPAGAGLGRGGLPRTRGDGPGKLAVSTCLQRASPHTRGWTRPGHVAVVCDGGFPAHAGMDRRPDRRAGRTGRLPRTRGDGPIAPNRPMPPFEASPHTRGWTQNRPKGVDSLWGFPAHAGMDPSRAVGVHAAPRLPRTRGDGPAGRRVGASRSPASPHTRGWTVNVPPAALCARGFPAHAGMDPGRTRPGAGRRRLPRTRGDGPVVEHCRRILSRASPHTRGWTLGERRGPAGRPGLPRTRGDGPRLRRCSRHADQASPHTRGWTRIKAARRVSTPGFPAHAGMDPPDPTTSTRPDRLPRTRGDGPLVFGAGEFFWWASPHTRGWTHVGGGVIRLVSGFPAHAGMDPSPSDLRSRLTRLPRTRGDGPLAEIIGRGVFQASPHTRGWTLSADDAFLAKVGFPAHAGMDRALSAVRVPHGRLPRTRGDGPTPSARSSRTASASPHTRGWTPAAVREAGGRGGFPAHAGMDPGRRTTSR